MDTRATNSSTSHSVPSEPSRYRLLVSGHVDEVWARDMCGLDVADESSDRSELRGVIVDQSALLGILRQIRDRGHDVILVERIPESGSEGEQR